MAMDKEVSKRLLREAALPTSRWVVVESGASAQATERALSALGWPLVVKPANAGSSVGVSVAHSAEELPAALAAARAVSSDTETPIVLVEEFLPGREFTVGVLGERALGVGEIVPRHEIFDYEVQVHAGDDERDLPGRDSGGARRPDARAGARYPPRPPAARRLARRLQARH
jgi:D-alanine-D-alanine ligase